ncbi:uncharacterized protein GGS25DRAFT_510653 [Hypoxylon fragiforme]|uniref:uncharacterized protein n=1 Tax=Hypoxylon fragiforme TaxID=63214 RepID=UPI0020C6BEE2|nr:uncharacterized protein GGS25DRAFT_510653 [Hypoxylon fragiforme]KAI2603254.1 hypothetical protein GGS25DRAFT_510653 [Hypoxylon fragiforme]
MPGLVGNLQLWLLLILRRGRGNGGSLLYNYLEDRQVVRPGLTGNREPWSSPLCAGPSWSPTPRSSTAVGVGDRLYYVAGHFHGLPVPYVQLSSLPAYASCQ